MIDIKKLSHFSPAIWLVYFGILFSIYFSLLNIGAIGEPNFSNVEKSTEFYWRIVWGLSSIAVVLISSVCIFVSMSIIHRNTMLHSGVVKIIVISLIVALTALIILLFYNAGIGGGAVSSFLTKAGEQLGIKIGLITDVTMTLAATSIFLIAASLCSMLFHSRNMTISNLRNSYTQLRYSFYITSVFLCTGITQIYLLFTWASYVIGSDLASVKMAHALTISGSIIFTIVFMTLFVPASVVLNTWIRNVAYDGLPTSQEFDYIEWRKSVGLYNSTSNNINNALILLSPVILGAGANLLSTYILN